MSKIQVNEVVNHFDNGAPDFPRGVTVTGVSTFSGAVSVGGTLTYEDVTSIDSVGIITAQSGIKVLAGGATITGNVGLGSQSPVSPLDVNGTVSVKGRYVMSISDPDMLNVGGVTASSALGISTIRLFTSDNVRLTISSEGYVTKPQTPAFFATHTTNSGSPVTGVLTYDTLGVGYYNNGSHLNVGTGKFTIPVAGIYHFHFHAFLEHASSVGVFSSNMVRTRSATETNITRQYGHNGDATNYGPPLSLHCTNYFEKDDTVHIDHTGKGLHGANGYFFGGYLVG
jgi:hypothetical protein